MKLLRPKETGRGAMAGVSALQLFFVDGELRVNAQGRTTEAGAGWSVTRPVALPTGACRLCPATPPPAPAAPCPPAPACPPPDYMPIVGAVVAALAVGYALGSRR
jgi:hypothetical protein